MEREIIIVLILGGLASIDLTEAFQTMWSQPLVSAPLLGWLLGDWQSGLFIGLLFQLVWLWYVPLGVQVFPDSAVGGIVGCVLFLHFVEYFSFNFYKLALIVILYSWGLSYVSGWVNLQHRMWNAKLVHRVEESLAAGHDHLNSYFALALGISFLRGAAVSVVGYLLGLGFVHLFMSRLLPIQDEFFNFVMPAVFGFGLASLFGFFGRGKGWAWLAGGAALAAGIVFLYKV